jgi:hypothetical protein
MAPFCEALSLTPKSAIGCDLPRGFRASRGWASAQRVVLCSANVFYLPLKVKGPNHARPALDLPHLCGPFDPESVKRALSQEPGQGADGPFHRLRPAHADGIRLRSPARARRGWQGRRAGEPSRRYARAARGHPARQDEHVDDDQRHGRRRGSFRCTSLSPTNRASTASC